MNAPTGQRRLIDEQVRGLHQPYVGRHTIARSQHHHISRHQVPRWRRAHEREKRNKDRKRESIKKEKRLTGISNIIKR